MPALTDSKVLTRLKSEVVQCPVPTILLKMKDTLGDFYERTKLDRVTLGPVDVTALLPTYSLPIPAGKLLVQAHDVRVNHIQLEEKSEDSIDLMWSDQRAAFSFSSTRDYHFGGLDDPTWREAIGTQPRFYYFEPNGDLRLVVIPETSYTGDRGIITRVSLKPDTDIVAVIDDAHWRDNKDVFVAGALARLFVMNKKPWTDLKMAEFWGSQYEAGVADLAARVGRSDIRNDREVYHSKAYA